jgi:hypothetical protein
MDINNLRVLNDYLNQTIDALTRQQALGGLTHSPFAAMGISPFAASPFAASSIYGQVPGLSHSAFGSPFANAFATPFTTPFAISPWAQAAPVVDPYSAARGLSHSAYAVNPWNQNPWSQTQLTHAIAARAQVLEAMCRSLGIPV